jgi:hypothetical protein
MYGFVFVMITKMNNDSVICFVNLFGYNSSLMYMLFEFLSDFNQDSNNSPDILNIIFGCKIMYNTCYLKKARFLWTIATRFDDKKREHVQRLCYDSLNHCYDSLNQFIDLKRVIFGRKYNHLLYPDILPPFAHRGSLIDTVD